MLPGPSNPGQRDRSNSARDKSKPRISLGPDTTALPSIPEPPKSYNLVVCGATSAENDGFIFGDFLGYCEALRQKNVAGDFWPCFPLHNHFEWLAKLKTPITDIKFGKFGPDRDQALFAYTKFQFEHRESWWEQIGQRVLKDQVLQWIMDKAAVAESGDVVNMIFCSHGSSGGGLSLGKYTLRPAAILDALGVFKEEVQVNLITNACYGSTFVGAMEARGQYYRYIQAAEGAQGLSYASSRSVSNRHRNMRFAQAVVMALARLDIPGITGGGPQTRILD